ncbi:hypothetical protein [Secundilactobacillus folii]|uniref:Bacteriocin n=1 Tax=Secundilactobacillus folii TaxID=2678357 RepID=A0A7X2XVU0_9LACO|nr:hypothetical protein [Secundilactobacillus folii]MTV82556.1 hypothetical protein [Secundilactobacillus folii]
MKKSILVTIAVAAGLAGGAVTTGTSAQAATWHQGMPKALRGVWHTKKIKFFGGVRFTIRIGKNYSHAAVTDPDVLNHTRYRYLGHHDYKVNGYEPIYSKKRTNRYFKWVSKHHIVYSDFLKKGYGASFYR